MHNQQYGFQYTSLWFFTIAALTNVILATALCSKDSDVLSFCKSNGNGNDVWVGEKGTVMCCANGFIGNIEWYRNDTGTFRQFLPRRSNYVFQENDQVLNILKTSMDDGGVYRCVARNETNNVSFDYRLFVHDCNDKNTDIKVETAPEPEIYVGQGDVLTLECRGIFGCVGSAKRDAFWSKKDSKGGYGRLRGSNKFFSVKTTRERNGTLVGSMLTFNTVEEDNYTSVYTCWLRKGSYQLIFNVKLIKLSSRFTSVVLATLSLLIFLPLICIGLAYPWRQRIIFWFNTKLHRLPKRYDSDKVDTDVTVLCSSPNIDFVQHNIVKRLRKFGYSVYFHDEDSQAGRPDALSLMEGLNRSSHGLLYLSKAEEAERFHDFFMDGAIRLHGGSRVVVVYQGSFSQSLRNLHPDLRERLKIVKRFQFPEGTNKRKLKNFWCSVRSCLPSVSRPSLDLEFSTSLLHH